MSKTAPQTATNSPFPDILNWSSGLPEWQADALRRIVLQGNLNPGDLDELEKICRSKRALVPPTSTSPLSAAHIPAGPDASSSVSLIRLAELKSVNRIRDGAAIEFGPSPGITVAFGDNGSGKSGFARVIKRACRARGTSPPIRPNIFDPNARPPATAKLVCKVGTVETPLKWSDGVPTDPRLSNIFVFDSASARLHVVEDGPASFIPRGLDLLPKLAKACDEVKTRINSALEATRSKIAQIQALWKHRAHTKVGKFVAGISAQTKVAEIEAMGVFDETMRSRLNVLVAALRSDPTKKATLTDASAARVRAFAMLVVQRATVLGSGKITEISTTIERFKAADAAARAAAEPQFDESYLTGTGGDAWRELWEIARAFSTTAYPDGEYPVVDEGARCILCQQELDSAAKLRFQHFEDYVRSQSRVRANDAARAVMTALTGFGQVSKLRPEYERIAADLAGSPAELLSAADQFVGSADSLLDHVQRSLRSRSWTKHPELTSSPAPGLMTVADMIENRAHLERSAHDPSKRGRLEAEREELEDLEWLSKVKADVISVARQWVQIVRLKKCQDDTNTYSITVKSGELYDTYVTQAYCDRFQKELGALGLQTLKAKMVPSKGAKGERSFGIRLEAPVGATVADVASEGEQRCIALAAFLAELSQASHRSALVFDDPVSSLDHARRRKVAVRLCVEARVRQVIVFTHDPVFLGDLLEVSERNTIPCEPVYLSWDGGCPGKCEKGLPHDWQKYTVRLDALGQDAVLLHKDWNPVPNPQNVAKMREAYSRFRATAEKIVQDVIFNGVVVRYRSYINVSPRMLNAVVGFSQAECDELLRLHKTACDCTAAHDPAAGEHAPVPTPGEFRADVEALKQLVENIKARRKADGRG
jgi:energy-coupling factor transporter ATP-binding protein EcfA2